MTHHRMEGQVDLVAEKESYPRRIPATPICEIVRRAVGLAQFEVALGLGTGGIRYKGAPSRKYRFEV